MPVYRFTTHDHSEFEPDDEGLVFADDNVAADEAKRALGEMIAEAMPNGNHTAMFVAVYDEAHREIFRAKMEMTTQRQ